MTIKKLDGTRPAWISNLPRAYWKSLEESERSPAPAEPESESEEAKTLEVRALDHYYAFQQRQSAEQRQSSLRKKASLPPAPFTGNRNANLQDANRRYTTLYDRRQEDRRNTPAASDSFSTNRRKTRERRAVSPHVSLFRLASLRDSAMPDDTVSLPYSAPLMPEQGVEPIRIEGLDYPITITGSMMQIGTAMLTLQEWAAISDNVILDNYGRKLLNFWREHRESLLAMGKGKA